MSGTRAPVGFFIYGRPGHARRALTALAANDGAAETDVVVYADGPRRPEDRDRVEAARVVARAAHGFRSLEVVERPENLGVARNIAEGVTDLMARAGRAIVVEEDVETARGFLDYMNAALDLYAGEPRVWHASGWTYDIDAEGLPPFFFWPVMNCWGWASWADRWAHYQRDPQRLLRQWTGAHRHVFNLDGAHDFFSQVEDNAAGRIATWAVFWYATIFERRGLCLTPTRPFARNIGVDRSGEHCGNAPEQPLEIGRRFDGGLPGRIEPHPEAIARIRARLTPSLYRRLSRRAKRAAKLLIHI